MVVYFGIYSMIYNNFSNVGVGYFGYFWVLDGVHKIQDGDRSSGLK